MILHSTPLSDSLRIALSLCHDDGHPLLVVSSWETGIEVTRADGSEPSFTEQCEVKTRVSAHETDADQTPTVRLRVTRVGDRLVVTVAEPEAG